MPGATASIAALPMYDWPELRAETDALWALIGRHLRAEGVVAPDRLTREGTLETIWRAPDLVLSQTCGLPYALHLGDRVALVGTPAYALEGCAPGEYRSAVVVRCADPAETLSDLRGRVAALNGSESQSGHAALLAAAAGLPGARPVFGDVVLSGAHRASICAVAEGLADVAAIDAVAWVLAGRYEPAAAALRVLHWTPPVPALPFITAQRAAAPRIRGALRTAIAEAPEALRAALLLTGIVERHPADYAPLASRFRVAVADGALPRIPA
ncbi:MAG: PhnD/SsuA/transferrin family substrate-binding protein [Pseudomonadota bacterium]